MSKLRIFLEMIKFEHTIFALPFAYAGALLASRGRVGLWQIAWITLAMVGARTAAMAFNRLADAELDAKNPRTMGRALPRRLLGKKEVWVYFFLAVALLLFSAAQLNRLALFLSPVALFFLIFYSYTKRFTWTSHLFLGWALGLAPIGAWLAVTGRIDWQPVVLGLAVTFWVAGFDVIYALQDVAFDQAEGLQSIPARFGVKHALLASLAFHILTLALFAVAGAALRLGVAYWIGLLLTAALLIYEHAIIKPDDLGRINTAFFTVNGVLSVGYLLFAWAALYY
ncbi:MAG: putative 4-hydroxybenzoate polyprenyltransferase [Firmicutes bacterium]|nr:putative 4-hydroxybenzoate polyprenyltransferase [Bacillota bacterium]